MTVVVSDGLDRVNVTGSSVILSTFDGSLNMPVNLNDITSPTGTTMDSMRSAFVSVPFSLFNSKRPEILYCSLSLITVMVAKTKLMDKTSRKIF